MKEGGWIVRGSAETEADYKARVNGSVLFNGYKRTSGYLTGQVFRKDLTITEESELRPMFERMRNDIDLQGNDIRTFAQKFFTQAIDEGARFILVQYPTIRMNDQGEYFDPQSEQWRKRTMAVDMENGWRPYFLDFGYDQLLGWRYEYMNGVKVLTQLRILETVNDFGELDIDDKKIRQVRIFERGTWATWRESVEGERATDWILVDSGQTSIPDIPLAVFMPGEQLTDLTAIPALEDLAYLNLRHWQATADQHVLMSYVRRPPWFGRGLVNDGESVTFGPGRMVHSNDPASDLRSVGVDPSSVEAGRGELKDLEERMSLYGLQMLTPALRASGGAKTATQSQQESSESVSQLQNWAQSLKDCFDQAFKFAAMFEGLAAGEEPEVKLPVDFQPGMGLEPQTLITAVERGIIPKQIAFEEFQRRGLVAESYEWQDVQGMLSRDDVAPASLPPLSNSLGVLTSSSQREARLTQTGQGV